MTIGRSSDDFHTFLSAIFVIQGPYCHLSALKGPCFQFLQLQSAVWPWVLAGTFEILHKTLISTFANEPTWSPLVLVISNHYIKFKENLSLNPSLGSHLNNKDLILQYIIRTK